MVHQKPNEIRENKADLVEEGNFKQQDDIEGSYHFSDLGEENDDGLGPYLGSYSTDPRTIQGNIRNLSSLVDNPEERVVDNKMMEETLANVGKNGYRILGISVWVVDEDTHKLTPHQGGWWHNDDNLSESEALDRAVNPLNEKHVPRSLVAPGVDIAGLLWKKPKKNPKALSRQAYTYYTSFRDIASENPSWSQGRMLWRDLKSLVHDPDTAKGPRLTLLKEAGFGQATGIPFKTDTCKGLVLFFCEIGIDNDVLNGLPNIVYLHEAAQLIGFCASMGEARRACIDQRVQIRKSRV